MESSVELRSEDAGLTIRAEHPGRATLTGEGYLRPLQCDNHNAELIGYILAGRSKLQFEPKPVAVRELKANGRRGNLCQDSCAESR